MKQWNQSGFAEIGSFFAPELWSELEREAHTFSATAEAVEHSRFELFRDGHMTSPKRDSVHSGGPALTAVVRSRDLLARVRKLTGLERLIPARFGYKYYYSGDFMGVHRDSVRSSVTITFALTDNLGHMNWAPDRKFQSNEEILNWIHPDNYLPDGESFPVGYREMRAFDGYNIPHWRMPFAGDLGILGTVSYFDL